jgi:hypothetical protein
LRHEGKKQTTFRADDYIPGRQKPDPFTAFNELDTFLFHMSAGRAERAEINLERLYTLVKWLDREWSKWTDALPNPYSGLLDSSPVCRQRNLENGVTMSTACTEVIETKLSLNYART